MRLENPFDKAPSHLRDATKIKQYKESYGVQKRVDGYIVDTVVTATLGSVTIAAEALDMHLSAKPNTVQNNLVRAGCRAIAVGAGYLTGQAIAQIGENY